MKARNRITALFEFSQTARLKGVFLNAENEEDQVVLEKALSHLLKPEKLRFVRWLFTMVTSGK